MDKVKVGLVLVLMAVFNPASAETLKATAVGCANSTDAEKLTTLLFHDRAAATAFSRPLVASRACLEFSKGLKIDVDQRRPPLVCIRLPGDLSCYWMAAALIDDHPTEKGTGGGRPGGGSRRH